MSKCPNEGTRRVVNNASDFVSDLLCEEHANDLLASSPDGFVMKVVDAGQCAATWHTFFEYRYELINKLAGAMLEYEDKIRSIVSDVPDDRVAQLVADCRQQARPGRHLGGSVSNFSMSEWDEVADLIECGFAWRLKMRKADAYMKETGCESYCFRCEGECKPEHYKEFDEPEEKP